MNQIIDKEKTNSKIYRIIPIDLLDKFKRKEVIAEPMLLPTKKEIPEI
jgi:hypothetical protein